MGPRSKSWETPSCPMQGRPLWACWCLILFEENIDSADEEEVMNEAGTKSVEAALAGNCQTVFRTCTVPQLALIAVASALAK